MKIRLTFKTPDVVDTAIEEAKEELVSQLCTKYDVEDECALPESVSDELEDKRYELDQEIKLACSRWIKYDECCTVEIDTKTNKALVLPV